MNRKRWLARNPAVQEAVDQVHRNISDRWSRILDENVSLCRAYLERSSNMTPPLRSHWKDLMRSIRTIIGALSFELPRVAAEHHSAVSTYPGKWLDDVAKEILREQLIWKDGHNIVDVWIKGVSDWRYQRRHILAFIYGAEDVDAGEALSALRRWVSKTIESELPIGFRSGCPLVRAEVELENLATPNSDIGRINEC